MIASRDRDLTDSSISVFKSIPSKFVLSSGSHDPLDSAPQKKRDILS